MSIERDKFLTEAMGKCWHEGQHPIYCTPCAKCGEISSTFRPLHFDFSTWAGFGLAWEWVQSQNWRGSFMRYYWNATKWNHVFDLINPDRFSDALYAFLKERKP